MLLHCGRYLENYRQLNYYSNNSVLVAPVLAVCRLVFTTFVSVLLGTTAILHD